MEKRGITLRIKREDLNDPFISGNKWWKLRENLEVAVRLGHRQLVTFGGAYSNHIYATAAAAERYGLKSIGIIRGEEIFPENPVLAFARSRGMHLHYISRENYGRKSDPEFSEELKKRFGEFYLIPEGGTNALAVSTCAELGRKILVSADFDYLCLPVGTGGTMAGLVAGLEGKKKVIGFSVLRNGSFLNQEVKQLAFNCSGIDYDNWEVETRYAFGGYAKSNAMLLDFMESFHKENSFILERVYTAKMMFGILDRIDGNEFVRGSKILALHTGGIHKFPVA